VNITSEQLSEMRSVTERAMARVKQIKEKTTEAMGQVVQTVEVGVAAFGFALARGRFEDKEGLNVVGVPVDLGVGVLAHVLGFMGAAGKYDEHLHNFGDGALACYLTVLGGGIGRDMKVKADGGTRGAGGTSFRGDEDTSGYLPSGRTTISGDGSAPAMSNAELAAILARAA